jgi:hypothetical protein
MGNLPEGFVEDTDREFGWEDEIQNDSPEFEVLPEGDYDFEVLTFERARHAGSDNLPPCNKAVIHIKVTGQNGATTTIKHNLFLHSKTEGMLCSFFAAIGQRKKGEKMTMNWNAVPGSKGRCRVIVKKVKNKGTDEEYTINNIKKFYEPAEKTPAQPSFQAGQF